MNLFLKKHRTSLLRAAAGIGLAAAFAIASPTWAAPSSGLAASPTQSSMSKSGGSQASSSRQTVGVLDINSASADQLKALPGVGDAYAKRIIASRPYHSKDQLVSKGVLPQGVYDKIKGKITARQSKPSKM